MPRPTCRRSRRRRRARRRSRPGTACRTRSVSCWLEGHARRARVDEEEGGARRRVPQPSDQQAIGRRLRTARGASLPVEAPARRRRRCRRRAARRSGRSRCPARATPGVTIASPAAIAGSHVVAAGASDRPRISPPRSSPSSRSAARRERAPELLVDDDARRACVIPLPPYFSGSSMPRSAELGELRPQRVGVADRVVLHRAHDVEAGSGARTAADRVARASPARE